MNSVNRLDQSKLSGSTLEQVQKALYDHFSGVAVHLDGPIGIRPNSEIYRAHIDTFAPIEAAVKHCLVPGTRLPDQSAAKEQFLALERVHGALAKRNTRYRVPTPLYFAPTLATFAMSWVDGESLTKKMRHPAVLIDGPGWFEDIGAWLGNFHSAGPTRRRLVNLNDRLGVAEELRTSPLPDKSFAKALLILEKTTAPLENLEVEVTWLHGDCKTDNFIISKKCVYGIDISLSCENPVEYDLAQFLNNLDLLLASPQSVLIRGARSRLEKAFWRGYSSTGPSVSHAYLNWLRLNFSLSFWHTMICGRKFSIRTWILNRIFATLVARLSGKLTYS